MAESRAMNDLCQWIEAGDEDVPVVEDDSDAGLLPESARLADFSHTAIRRRSLAVREGFLAHCG